MGKPKALLQLGNRNFIQHIVEVVSSAGIENIIVVLGSEPAEIQKTVVSNNCNVVVNKDWKNGQLSSIITGLNAVGKTKCDGIIILPVDHPLITVSLIRELVRNYQESKKKLIIPTYHKRRGHPIIISNDLITELKAASAENGMRSVVHAHEDDICEVVTEEEGVLINIDTPDDYKRYVGTK